MLQRDLDKALPPVQEDDLHAVLDLCALRDAARDQHARAILQEPSPPR